MPPHPVFSRASGYLLIGYSKISETRRYRRKKRGDAREDENRRKRERGREVGKGGGMGKRGHRRWEGCRGPYARVGVNYHYPPKTRLSFCSPRVPFCFFPRCPTPPTPPSESFDSSARLCHPGSPSHPPPPPIPLPTTVHLKYEFDITFHPTALARPPPRTSSSVASPLVTAVPTITGPRTI